MDQNYQKIGLLNWIWLAISAAGSLLVTNYLNSAAGWPATVILGAGFLVAVVSYFQMRLEERERLEKLEFDELNKSKSSAALFTAEAENFPARRSREQFEKFFLPAFTILLFAAQAAAVVWQWKELAKPPVLATNRATFGMSLFGLFALVLFVLGKYSTGLARLDGQRLLRPVAGYLLLCAYACFAVIAGIAAVVAGFAQMDVLVARLLCLVLALTAIENLFGLIFEIYRPRIKGKIGRLLYDSRLVGLLGQPEGIIKTAAQALDYQFGFKVSETGFYKFFEKWLPVLIPIQIGILFLSTCVVFIEPGEQGLLERFGQTVAARPVLEPGPHLKFPWPIDKVYRYGSGGLQSFNIGFVQDPEKERNERTVLWTVSHYKEEFNLLVASREQAIATTTNAEIAVPVNLLTVSIPVQFQIKDVRAFAYNYSDAGDLLEKVATREVVRYLVSVDLIEIMSTGRAQAAEKLRASIQDRADEMKLGVHIVFVGLQDIHPPVKVAESYEAVIGAQQEIQAKILEAEGYRAKTVPLADAEGRKKILQAEAYRLTRIAGAAARSAQFTNQITAFTASPRVYPERLSLQTFARASEGTRKYIVAPTNTHDVIQLNLEDKVRTDLLDLSVPEARKFEPKK